MLNIHHDLLIHVTTFLRCKDIALIKSVSKRYQHLVGRCYEIVEGPYDWRKYSTPESIRSVKLGRYCKFLSTLTRLTRVRIRDAVSLQSVINLPGVVSVRCDSIYRSDLAPLTGRKLKELDVSLIGSLLPILNLTSIEVLTVRLKVQQHLSGITRLSNLKRLTIVSNYISTFELAKIPRVEVLTLYVINIDVNSDPEVDVIRAKTIRVRCSYGLSEFRDYLDTRVTSKLIVRLPDG